MNNKKRFLRNTRLLARKLCFVIILFYSSVMFTGCAEVLTVGAIVLGAAIVEEAVNPKKPAPKKTYVNRTYKPSKTHVIRPQIPPPAKKSDYQLLMNKALQAYANLDWNKSERLFKQILQGNNISESKKWKPTMLLGAISYQKGDIYIAEHYFGQAKNIDYKAIPSSSMFPPEMIKFYKSVKR